MEEETEVQKVEKPNTL